MSTTVNNRIHVKLKNVGICKKVRMNFNVK